jgi:tetratricopeptide (TPR) repeat protein
MIKTLKTAILFGVAFFFAFNTVAFAQKKKSGETYKDIISKAHNLVLQKDRQQAQNILLAALKNEKANTKAHKELKNTLSEISNVFLSDKSQQMYELSLSLKRTDLNQAQQRLGEALRMEPDNVTLLLESARQSLMKNECSNAEEMANKAQKLIPGDDELMLVQAQIRLCENDLVGYQKIKDAATTTNFPLEWTALDVDRSVREKNFLKAKEALTQFKKISKQHPESNYWSWKLDNEQKVPNADAAQKYVMSCRNLSVQVARQYRLDPWLCGHVAEAENYLKNTTQTQ